MKNSRTAALLVSLTLCACSPDAVAPDASASDAALNDASIPDASVTDAPADVTPSIDASDASTDNTPSDATPTDVTAVDASDASTALRRCPSTGRGALTGDLCFNLTAEESGLSASGANATEDEYALRPASGARGVLMIFLHGSGGTPRGVIASPDSNVYSAARAAGLHVLSIAYRSDDAVGTLCSTATDRDLCFLATRTAIVTGVARSGAADPLASIALHEGVYARVGAALLTLAERDPDGRWGQFYDVSAGRDVARGLRWASVIVAGHSQGGGHAALLAKLHPVRRAVMFSSPCDLSAAAPAAWLTHDATWATPSANLFGYGSSGDVVCPGHVPSWGTLGLPAANRDNTAVVCTGETAHGASIKCVENAARWSSLFAP